MLTQSAPKIRLKILQRYNHKFISMLVLRIKDCINSKLALVDEVLYSYCLPA